MNLYRYFPNIILLMLLLVFKIYAAYLVSYKFHPLAFTFYQLVFHKIPFFHFSPSTLIWFQFCPCVWSHPISLLVLVVFSIQNDIVLVGLKSEDDIVLLVLTVKIGQMTTLKWMKIKGRIEKRANYCFILLCFYL